MSKWLCIDDGKKNRYLPSSLKEGEIYEGEYNQIRDLIYIKLEDGSLYGYSPYRFRSLADIREEQIKSILDDE